MSDHDDTVKKQLQKLVDAIDRPLVEECIRRAIKKDEPLWARVLLYTRAFIKDEVEGVAWAMARHYANFQLEGELHLWTTCRDFALSPEDAQKIFDRLSQTPDAKLLNKDKWERTT